MKILVLSDSHGALGFMRQCVDAIRPQAVVHLGDYYEDGENLKAEYPALSFHQVPGNCDLFRCPSYIHKKLCYEVGGVVLFMAHGHEQNVKYDPHCLVAEARAMGAKAALYGHTHVPDCHQEPDGMWVLNPGSSRYGCTAGVIETAEGRILSCRLLSQEELL